MCQRNKVILFIDKYQESGYLAVVNKDVWYQPLFEILYLIPKSKVEGNINISFILYDAISLFILLLSFFPIKVQVSRRPSVKIYLFWLIAMLCDCWIWEQKSFMTVRDRFHHYSCTLTCNTADQEYWCPSAGRQEYFELTTSHQASLSPMWHLIFSNCLCKCPDLFVNASARTLQWPDSLQQQTDECFLLCFFS